MSLAKAQNLAEEKNQVQAEKDPFMNNMSAVTP